MTAMIDRQWPEQAAQVNSFVSRFDNESYRQLAYHAALPLVLTPELVHYLRKEFLLEENVPWEAEADLLLSDLCSQVGYELYTMDTQVREYLLEKMRVSPLGLQRMQEVAQVLISYVSFLSRAAPQVRQRELEAQRWAAMTYMGDDSCQQVAQEIAERLLQVGGLSEEDVGEQSIRSELARLTRITKELAPQLESAPMLVEYAQVVQQVLRNPEAVNPLDVNRSFSVGDVELKVSSRLLPGGIESLVLSEYPPLETLPFDMGELIQQTEQEVDWPPLEVRTVQVVTLEPKLDIAQSQGASQSQTLGELTRFWFSFDVGKVTLDAKTEQWVVTREPVEAEEYRESLGDEFLPLYMVSIPGGSFIMGSPENESGRRSAEAPQHRVTVDSFYMSKYPITQAQWRFVASLPQVNRELDADPSSFKGDNLPAEQVSWYEAVEFCDRISVHTNRPYGLPTEAEWEYACRANTTTPYHFGEKLIPEVANFNGKATTPIDQFDVANAFGLYDMHGNVFEWCQDHWHENYENAPIDGSAWLTDNDKARRVIRGGSWIYIPENCRSACRNYITPEYRSYNIGFRVVSAPPRILL